MEGNQVTTGGDYTEPNQAYQQPPSQYLQPPQYAPQYQQQPQYAPAQGYHPQQQYAPGYYPQAQPPKKKRRVFLWVFLAIQALMLVWIIAGAASNSKSMNQGVTAADTQQAQQMCGQGGWRYLSPSDTLSGANTNKSSANYTSESACVTDQAKDNAALSRAGTTAGTAIGVGLLIGLWVAIDIILGLGYLIYKVARR